MGLLTKFCLGSLILVWLAACQREFDNPFLPGSQEYAGAAWSRDQDGNGIADSVEKYAPGCTSGPSGCLHQALAKAGVKKPVLVASLSAPDLAVRRGEARAPAVTVLPPEAADKRFELQSQDPSVADIQGGKIYGVGIGATTVTARAVDGSGKTGIFRVSVTLELLMVSAQPMQFTEGEPPRAPILQFYPPEADTQHSLVSSDPGVALITGDDKRVSPVRAGSTLVTVQAGKLSAVFTVTVKPAPIPIPVRSVQVEDMVFILEDDFAPSARKRPVIHWDPANAADKGYTLKSEDNKVAKIAGDSVQAGKLGKTTVTLTTSDGGLQSDFKVQVCERNLVVLLRCEDDG